MISQKRQVDDDKAVLPFASQMQKSMLDEMDKRRHDWEKEMHRMQEDFFKVKLAKPQPTNGTSNHHNDGQVALPGSGYRSNMSAAHMQPTQPEYVTDEENGSEKLCRWKFDVSGYHPSEISVKVNGEKLVVSARHADVKDGSNSSIMQLNKQMDIPSEVVLEEMTSYMTREGVLVVQAPLSRDQNMLQNFQHHVTAGSSRDTTESEDDDQALDYHFRPIELPPEQPPSDDAMQASRRHIVKTDDGDDLLKIVLDLGRNDYHPDDVSVQLTTKKVLVRVERDERLPGSDNSIHREISRDIDVPETVHMPSMRAALSPDGKLWICASLTTNSDHRRVSAYVVQMLPRYSQRCHRVSQLYAITN